MRHITGWSSLQHSTTEELDEFAWLRGFFRSSHRDWDGRTWSRNFEELRVRDVAVNTLGPIRNLRGLDVGGGDGTYAFVLAALGARMAVQDLSESAIARGEELAKTTKLVVEFVCANAEHLEFPDSSFEFVFSADFFEHVAMQTKQQVFAEIFRVLRPGGTLVIKTPNLRYLRLSIWWQRVRQLVRLKSPFIHIVHTRNNPDNEHHGLTTHAELTRLCHDNFFHVPVFTQIPVERRGLPRMVVSLLSRFELFSPHLVMRTQKSVFVGFSLLPVFAGRGAGISAETCSSCP